MKNREDLIMNHFKRILSCGKRANTKLLVLLRRHIGHCGRAHHFVAKNRNIGVAASTQ